MISKQLMKLIYQIRNRQTALPEWAYSGNIKLKMATITNKVNNIKIIGLPF